MYPPPKRKMIKRWLEEGRREGKMDERRNLGDMCQLHTRNVNIINTHALKKMIREKDSASLLIIKILPNSNVSKQPTF